MATLLGYTIANDPDSVKLRQESPRGYIANDETALIEFGILIRKNNAVVFNERLGLNIDQIRDFLNWVVGKRTTPLPDLVRKILCLKRARIVNSVASTGTSPALRTKENNMIAEIDTMLYDDGVTNPEDKQKCLAQNAGKYDSRGGAQSAMANAKAGPTGAKGETGATGPTGPTGPKGLNAPMPGPVAAPEPPVAAPEPPVSTTVGATGSHCTTIVNCDNSTIIKEIEGLKTSVQTIVDHLKTQAVAKNGKNGENGENAVTAPSGNVDNDIAALKGNTSDFSIILQRLGDMDKMLRELLERSTVVKNASSAVEAAKNGDHTELKKLLEEILAILRKSPPSPIEASVADEKAEEVKTFTENPDIMTILKEIKKEVVQINGDDIDNSVLAIVKAIKTQLNEVNEAVGDRPAKILEIINTILPGVNAGIDKLESKFTEVMKGINSIRSNISDLSGSLPDRFDEVLVAISKIQPQASVDYGPQFTHIDESMRRMYAERDYTRRFDELNQKVDDLMDLLRRCCGGGQLQGLPAPPARNEPYQLPGPAPAPAPALLGNWNEQPAGPTGPLMLENRKGFNLPDPRNLFGLGPGPGPLPPMPTPPEPVEPQLLLKNMNRPLMLENKKNNKPKRKRIVIGNNNSEPSSNIADTDEDNVSFEPRKSRGLPAGSDVEEKAEEEEAEEEEAEEEEAEEEAEEEGKPERKRLNIKNNENSNNIPKPIQKDDKSARKLFGPEKTRGLSASSEEDDTTNNSTNNTNNNDEQPPPPPNEMPPPPKTDKESRKTTEVGKQLTEAVGREPGRGKSIDSDVKYVQLKKLQEAYEDGDKGDKARDFKDVEKLVNEFLDGFDDNGPLKTAFLKNYKTKLDKTHWTLYLKNLFEAIGKLSNKPSVLNATRKKGGRRTQIKSSRITRKNRK